MKNPSKSNKAAKAAVPGRNQPAPPVWEEVWADDLPMYRLWFEFICCSPSYELAKRLRANQLTAAETAALPADISTVLKVYDDFGDLKNVTFRDWWIKKAKKYFGAKSSTPLVMYAGPTYVDDKYEADLRNMRAELMHEDQGWARKTSRTLHFSTALKRKDVLRMIKAELDKLEFDQQPEGNLKPKYPMGKIGKMRSALDKYLRTLKNKAMYPDEELWSIGVRSDINETAKTWPRTDGRPDSMNEQHHQALAIATSRALLRARMICEHAARGEFPVHDKLQTAKEFVAIDLNQCVTNIAEMFDKETRDREISRKKVRDLMIKYGVTPTGRYADE